jgi:hypothetical protein
MKTTLFLTLLLGAITAAARPAPSASVEPAAYTITEIAADFGYRTSAVDINDLGQVVITIHSPIEDDVYLWEEGALTYLASDSYAVSLNNLSQAVGIANYNGRIQIWQPGGPVIGTNLPYTPTDMGNDGSFVGYHLIQQGTITRGGVWTLVPPFWTDLPVMHGNDSTSALAENSSGVIVGWSTAARGRISLAVWQNDTIQIIGGFPYDMTAGYAINDANLIAIAGMNNVANIHTAYTYNLDTAVRTRINTHGDSIPVDINAAGDVVLIVDGAPTLWSAGVSTPLSRLIPRNSGWTLTTVTGINDDGWICGTGLLNGAQRGYLLKP